MTDEQRLSLRIAMRSVEDLGRVMQVRINELRAVIDHATKEGDGPDFSIEAPKSHFTRTIPPIPSQPPQSGTMTKGG